MPATHDMSNYDVPTIYRHGREAQLDDEVVLEQKSMIRSLEIVERETFRLLEMWAGHRADANVVKTADSLIPGRGFNVLHQNDLKNELEIETPGVEDAAEDMIDDIMSFIEEDDNERSAVSHESSDDDISTAEGEEINEISGEDGKQTNQGEADDNNYLRDVTGAEMDEIINDLSKVFLTSIKDSSQAPEEFVDSRRISSNN